MKTMTHKYFVVLHKITKKKKKKKACINRESTRALKQKKKKSDLIFFSFSFSRSLFLSIYQN